LIHGLLRDDLEIQYYGNDGALWAKVEEEHAVGQLLKFGGPVIVPAAPISFGAVGRFAAVRAAPRRRDLPSINTGRLLGVDLPVLAI
jgi:hypothetical protein